MSIPTSPTLTRKDFATSNPVRWCPGCGDYSILTAMQGVLPTLGQPKENFVFISGIGCSSRFPYYMNTYGFHTIHGRAPALATGVKAMNPDLQVWVITGDGDALSIGGNHFIHAIRRNQDLKIILFNNQIYGLTKGQYSPTSRPGTVSPSTPQGSLDLPLSPANLALGAGITFYARTSDNDVKHMSSIFTEAASHKGTAVIEVLQNCVVFADKVHENYYGRKEKAEHLLYLENGKPMTFGKESPRGIVLKGMSPKVLDNPKEDEVLVHDESDPDGMLSWALANMNYPEFPVPVGVFRKLQKPVYHESMEQSLEAEKKDSSIESLLRGGSTWEVD